MPHDLRIGRERRRWRKKRRPVGWQATVGVELTPSQLQSFLTHELNATAETLNTAIEQQFVAGQLVDFNLAHAFTPGIAGWRGFMNAKLPTSFFSRSTSPQYKDGPIGWRQWYKDNIDLADASKGSKLNDLLTRWGKEYQFALSVWRDRFIKAGGLTELAPIEKPGVEEMPGAIEPVEFVDVVKTVALAPVTATAKLGEGIGEQLRSTFRLSPGTLKKLKIGAAATGGVLMVALLAPYLAPRRRRGNGGAARSPQQAGAR